MSYEYLVNAQQARGIEGDEVQQTARYFEGKDEAIREEWKRERIRQRHISEPDWPFWPRMATPTPDLTLLPDFSLFIQFRFRLAGAYLSRADRPFYLIDNPLRRDTLSRLPYIAPTSWKGSLRTALTLHPETASRQGAVRRLLGNPKGAEKDFAAGRLRFFPSFFTDQGVELINPHDRVRRVGKNPILMECVPAGSESTFSLLYVPTTQWRSLDDRAWLTTIAEDWDVLAVGLPALFLTWGVGAKTSSGHGIAHKKFVADKKRRHQPAARMIAKFVPGGKLPAVTRFEQQYGRLDEFAEDEWRELLNDQETVLYEEAVEAREKHRNIQTEGQVESTPEDMEALRQTLRVWADQVRHLVPTEGGPQ